MDSEELKDELLQALEGAANFMRGMTLDPAIPTEQKIALIHKTREIESVVEKHLY